jgi:hypothetical protein
MRGVLLDTGSMSPTMVANMVIDSIMATPKISGILVIMGNVWRAITGVLRILCSELSVKIKRILDIDILLFYRPEGRELKQ